MKTRNAEPPQQKSPTKKPTAKKTPPILKEPSTDSATPQTTQSKTPSSTQPKQSNVTPTAKATTPKTSASQPQTKVEVSASGEAAKAGPEVKPVPAGKTVVKKIIKKVKSPNVKVVAKKTPKPAEVVKVEKKDCGKGEANVVPSVSESKKEEDTGVFKVGESPKKEEPNVTSVSVSEKEEDLAVSKVEESSKEEEPVVALVVDSAKVEEADVAMEQKEVKEVVEEEQEPVEDTTMMESDLPVDMVERNKEVDNGKEIQAEDEKMVNEGTEDDNGEEVLEEPVEEESAKDDMSEPDEEAEGLEQMEISDMAKEMKIKKAQEIFVGGLDRDAVEDDVKMAFEKIGKILEVRMQKHPSTGKNKGYAFVRFADKEQASRALSELKNPVICGKACGIAPSEDKNMLFLGNICNTWTKEAIKNRLKEYGIEGVENITLVPDARQAGVSKGFAFVEFPCHSDAMLAYKRLQKPDVVFGHAERTAKVAFAEPLREPDPKVMAQVKSVFVDGLPPHWDEERVREHFKVYGEIESIMLARNRPTAKRKDFGFVDFTTHEAAVSCIAGVNNTELGDDKSKAKVKVRLSNPLPKTQAVKGGIRGGFRIGRSGTFSKFGRGFGRGMYQRGKGFARGQPERFAVGAGRRRPGENIRSQAAATVRSDLSRQRRGGPGRSRGQNIPPRGRQYLLEGDLDQPFGGRYLVDDPYMFNDRGHGIKRPFYMMEQEPAYMEPSRLRRLPQYDPLISRGSRHQDPYGAGSDLYSHDYYVSDYGHGAYSSTYGRDPSFRGGYYY